MTIYLQWVRRSILMDYPQGSILSWRLYIFSGDLYFFLYFCFLFWMVFFWTGNKPVIFYCFCWSQDMLRGLILHYLSMEEEGGDIFTVYGCWIEVVDTAGVALGVGFGSSSFAFWLRESARLPVLCRARLAFEVCKQWAHAWYSLLFGCLGIRCNVGMPRAVNIQKKNVHYRGGRFLYQWVPRWPVTIQ